MTQIGIDDVKQYLESIRRPSHCRCCPYSLRCMARNAPPMRHLYNCNCCRYYFAAHQGTIYSCNKQGTPLAHRADHFVCPYCHAVMYPSSDYQASVDWSQHE